jgi:hypothetical protein
VLSDLQQRIAGVVGRLPEARSFALAGGGALILRGDVDRRTRDPAVFAEMTLQFGRFRPADIGLDEEELPEIERRVVLWHVAALDVARERGRGTDHDRGLER